jgi:uncharacterized protein
MLHLLVFLVGAWAGAQNALAGGGSFLILPTLMLSGMDARAANITSCVALFPAQLATGWTGRRHAEGVGALSLRALYAISVAGGAVGAVVLLVTSREFFARLVPWLVLFATLLFAYGSFRPRREEAGGHMGPFGAAVTQFLISVYGGYFGGGAGFLIVAALTLAGQNVRVASATKNILAGVMNAAAVAIFLFSSDLHWSYALATGLGATIGGIAGARLLHRVNEKALRYLVVIVGVLLTIGLFERGG